MSRLAAATLAALCTAAALPALAAEEGVELVGRAEGVSVAGEEALAYRVLPAGRSLGAKVLGPGEVTLRLRRLGAAPVTLRIERDGGAVGDVLVLSARLEHGVAGRREKATAAKVLTIPVIDGDHVVTVRASGDGTALVSFAFAASVGPTGGLALAPLMPLAGLTPLPLPGPKAPPPPVAALPDVEGRTLRASEDHGPDVAMAAPPIVEGPAPLEEGPELFRLTPRVGLAIQPQFGATSVAVGLSLDAGVAAQRRLALGLSIDWYRFAVEATGAPIPGAPGGASIDVSSAQWVLPVLATLTVRLPVGGDDFFPWVGLGGGAFVTGVEIEGSGSGGAVSGVSEATVAPGGALFAGVGVPAGPGRVAAELRYHVASGEVEGASKSVQAGGTIAQAGYQLLF